MLKRFLPLLMQQAFFSQVATPIVTKMFQCGMIP